MTRPYCAIGTRLTLQVLFAVTLVILCTNAEAQSLDKSIAPPVSSGDAFVTDLDQESSLIQLDGTPHAIRDKALNPALTTFTDIVAGLPGVSLSSTDWGDYDNDGDLDVLISGWNGTTRISQVRRNNGGIFVDIGAGLTPVYGSSGVWGDYDNDGDLDILLTGSSSNGTLVSQVYHNDNGVFTDIAAALRPIVYGAAAWGDYDNDGDLDILINGWDGSFDVALVYRNTDGVFTDVGAGLTGMHYSSAAWGDYDNDGDLDILLTGESGSSIFTKIYRNENGGFVEIGTTLTNVTHSSGEWGDYDNDGDLDVLLTGWTGSTRVSKIYSNDTGTFVDIGAGLQNVSWSSAVWGDYDNDGDFDVLLSGWDGPGVHYSHIYRNDTGVFTNTGETLTGVVSNSASWGDYDSDGDLDILIAGWTGSVRTSIIYRNDIASTNTPPSPPTNLTGSLDGSIASLNWTSATDLETPSAGLTYNVRVGTSPGTDDVFTDMANNSTGYRRVARIGNISHNLSLDLELPGDGIYYWSVQAVDAGFRGGAFGTEQILNVNPALFPGVAAGLTGAFNTAMDWGDYDGDGDLDLLLTGVLGVGMRISQVYRNDNGTLTDINAGLAEVARGGVAWGDYDNDGDLDILLTGTIGSLTAISKIYRNDNGSFIDINAGLPGVVDSSVDWGDYDNDGDLDIVMSGAIDFSMTGLTRVYRNNNGSFVDIGAGLMDLTKGSVVWGDYDGDSDLDILLTGETSLGTEVSKVYRNEAGLFSDIGANISNVSSSRAVWGDYDSDGDLDILLTGKTGSSYESKIYRNIGGNFTDISANLTGVVLGSADWGDYDNDGDLDVLLTGELESFLPRTEIYSNDGGVFTATDAGLPHVKFSSASWSDFDNDGDLDIALAGYNGFGFISEIFLNDFTAPNSPPGVPGNLTSNVVGTVATLSWTAATDAETPTDGLTYNIRVGTTPGSDNLVSAMADLGSGVRRIIEPGNAGHNLSWEITLPGAGTYYWSVQAVDSAFEGSMFASEQSMMVIAASSFTKMDAGLIGLAQTALEWGDYDSDGDLDIILAGYKDGIGASFLYQNNSGTFVETGVDLPALMTPSINWVDFDNDGDLDVFLTGTIHPNSSYANLFRNDNGVFIELDIGITTVQYSSSAWGDFDNDGDPDLLIAGYTDLNEDVSQIYRNDGGIFVNIEAGLTGVRDGAVMWIDIDNDSNLDIVLSGRNGTNSVSKIYRNDNGQYIETASILPGLSSSSLASGDYDNDGDLDILLAGWNGSYMSKIFRNNSGSFTDIGANLAGVTQGSASWGDYDNDGDLDILLVGESIAGWTSPVSQLYRNDSGIFTNIDEALDGVMVSSAAWGDYDNDGDLDILLSGDGILSFKSLIYRNDLISPNAQPSEPAALKSAVTGTVASLSWSSATDQETQPLALTYNLRIGSTPGADDIFAGMADLTNGYRRVPAIGNTGHNLTWDVNLPNLSTYYWSVQAIDSAFEGGPFATEQILEATPVGLFEQIDAELPNLNNSAVAWGDYDNDGDLDLMVAGATSNIAGLSQLFRNDGGTFVPVASGLPDLSNPSIEWGDYDNDGDLDLLLTGYSYSAGNKPISRVYRNEFGLFEDINAGLLGVYASSTAWGDYDNDGDLDILLSGQTVTGSVSIIYRNDARSYVNISAGLPGLSSSSVAWGDYDNDGDLDFLLTGNGTGLMTSIYENINGVFSDIGAGLPTIYRGSAKWGDFDADGDLDILITGDNTVSGQSAITAVYRNDSSQFIDINAGIVGAYDSDSAWGDYDNDGDLDILISGNSGSNIYSAVYQNTGGVFTDVNADLIGTMTSAVTWADYDNDGDLDFLITGEQGSNLGGITTIYRNNSSVVNAAPSAPSNLSLSIDGTIATLTWDAATDAKTPSPGLTYNIRIGSSPGAGDVFSGMSDPLTGYRKIPAIGNVNHNLSWSIELPGTGEYYWTVQATDSAFEGGQFAPEETFAVIPLEPFIDINAGLTGVSASSVAWGDFDNDGDLDILLTGSNGVSIALIYRNMNGVFEVFAGLEPVASSSVAWGDYDNDGDLDVIITGRSTAGDKTSIIYRNESGNFVDINAGLVGVVASAVAWGDYDNDGDLDIVLTGEGGDPWVGKIYRNDNGIFTDIAANITAVGDGSVDWGDYDGDGDLDILLTGFDHSYVAKVYQNIAGTFTDIGANLRGVILSSSSWGDFDNDGDLDILLAGRDGNGSVFSGIYKNDNGVFTDIQAGLMGVLGASVEWGDYDNDGDLDILLSGTEYSQGRTKIYQNNSGVFTEFATSVIGTYAASSRWGDYDNDGDLDILVTGTPDGGLGVAKIYQNTTYSSNSAPQPPSNLNSSFSINTATLSWDASTDPETPSPGLTYNIRVGTSPGAGDIFSGMSDASTGYRKIPASGNASHSLTWSLDLTEIGAIPFYWSVQAIDTGFQGSVFASSQLVSAIDDTPEIPSSFALNACVPNPFNPQTSISFDLPKPSQVSLKVYTVSGRHVKTLVLNGSYVPGRHAVIWNGQDDSGHSMASGVYFYRLIAGDFQATNRMTLLK